MFTRLPPPIVAARTLLFAMLLLAAAGCSGNGAGGGGLTARPGRSLLLAPSPVVLPGTECSNYFLISATINGRGPFALLLDTGASQTVLSERAAAALGADARTAPANLDARGADGRTQTVGSVVRLRTLVSGGMELRDLDAIALDLSGVQAALGTRVDGILGYPAFDGLLLTLDYPGRRVTVAEGSLPKPDGDLVLPLLGRTPRVELRIGQDRAVALLDSGKAGGLSLRGIDRLDLASPPTPVGTGVAIGGTFVRRMGRLRGDIALGGITLRTPIVEDNARSDLIGAEVMRPFAVTFDQTNRRVRFAPAITAAPGEPVVLFPPVRGIGAGFDYAEGWWAVGWIFPETPAELAGLQKGDVVVRYNGRRLRELACSRPTDLFSEGDVVLLDVIRDRRRIRIQMPIAVLVP